MIRPSPVCGRRTGGTIVLNYTSGTRGDSKRVMPSHRSAYPMSVLQIVGWAMDLTNVSCERLVFHLGDHAGAWQGDCRGSVT
jgi:fatty-acyl-CoA synthase